MKEAESATQNNPDVTEMLLESAAALVSSTYPAPQAEPIMQGLARSYNADAEIVMLPTLVLSETRKNHVPQLRSVTTSYRFDQMVKAQSIIAQARQDTSHPHLIAQSLRNITNSPPLFAPWLRVLGYALSAAGYAATFRMDIPALGAAFAIGALIGILVLVLSKFQRVVALIPLIAAFIAGIAVSSLASFFDRPDPLRLIAVLVVVLLPGATLTSGILELVTGHMISGASRLAYGAMILATMVFGGALGIALTGLSQDRLENITITLTPQWVGWVGVIVYGVGTFLYFCSPLHMWLPSLMVMLVSFAFSVFLIPFMGVAVSAGLATAIGLILSWALNARVGGGPGDLALFLPTFWLIVPGTSGFVGIAGAIENNVTLESFATTAGLTFFAMAIGIMIASAIFPALSKITPDAAAVLKRSVGLITQRNN